MDAAGGNAEVAFPLNRIRTIMKSSLNTGKISNDVLFVMSKATEYFVNNLTKGAHQNQHLMIRYDNLSNLALSEKNLEFLLQIIPKKITVVDFKTNCEANSSDSSDSSDNDL